MAPRRVCRAKRRSPASHFHCSPLLLHFHCSLLPLHLHCNPLPNYLECPSNKQAVAIDNGNPHTKEKLCLEIRSNEHQLNDHPHYANRSCQQLLNITSSCFTNMMTSSGMFNAVIDKCKSPVNARNSAFEFDSIVYPYQAPCRDLVSCRRHTSLPIDDRRGICVLTSNNRPLTHYVRRITHTRILHPRTRPSKYREPLSSK